MTVAGEVIGVVFMLCVVILWCYMAFWVAKDARQNGLERWKTHGLATLFFGVVYGPAYYVFIHD